MSLLLFRDCTKLACCDTSATLDTGIRINAQSRQLLARCNVFRFDLMDRISRTALLAHLAAEALILIDHVAHELLAYMCRTSLRYERYIHP